MRDYLMPGLGNGRKTLMQMTLPELQERRDITARQILGYRWDDPDKGRAERELHAIDRAIALLNGEGEV